MKSFIILCGGMSKRMGQDKGSMLFHNKAMVLHVIEKLSNVADEIVLILRDQAQVEKYKKILTNIELPKTDLRMCTDINRDQGPLVGILTGLINISSNQAMVLPCDSPCISESFVNNIFKYSMDQDYDAYVPRWPDNRLEPLHAIYKKSTVPMLKTLLKEDVRDVRSYIKRIKVEFINAESVDPSGKNFFNINQLEDLQKIS